MASLRRRLLLILIGLFMLVWFVAFAATFAAATRRIEVLFDAELAHYASVLLTFVEAGPRIGREASGAARNIPLSASRFSKVLAFAVWSGERAVLRSENAPESRSPARDGYENIVFNGRHWRGYTLRSVDGGLAVWVGEPFSLRSRLVNEIARDELFPLLLGIPLLAALAWWGVARGLVPLHRVASEVALRSPKNLNPVDLQGVPTEINAVVEKLNALLLRLREAFESERRFTADAAHEIRTPLAGIKTHMQVALRTTSDAQRRHEMEQVIKDVDRTTHLVEQLLTLARLDREPRNGEAVVDLLALAGETMAMLGQEAARKEIALTLHGGGPVQVRGDAIMLGAMIRNLVDNAVRYSPARGRVEIGVATGDDRVVLTVTDNGLGIAAEERMRVFDRFYRGSTTSAQGCGLGLSIVKRVADLHHAIVELTDAPAGHGLRAKVIFSGRLS